MWDAARHSESKQVVASGCLQDFPTGTRWLAGEWEEQEDCAGGLCTRSMGSRAWTCEQIGVLTWESSVAPLLPHSHRDEVCVSGCCDHMYGVPLKGNFPFFCTDIPR